MSLKKEIDKISNLFTLVETADEHGLSLVKQKIEKIDENTILENVVRLNKNKGFYFPAIEEYVSLYIEYFSCYLIAEKLHLNKIYSDYRKELQELCDYLSMEGDNKIERIYLGVNHQYTMKLFSPIITKQIISILRAKFLDSDMVEKDFIFSFKGIDYKSSKSSEYKKRFLEGMGPLFKYLKKHNSNKNETELCKYIGEFACQLGFNFYDKEINDPVEAKLLCRYFREMKFN